MDYKDYLRSNHWKDLKRLKLSRSSKRCGICGSNENIDCHHLVYKNLYDVETTDLRRLCRNCHFTAHELIKAGKIRFKNINHHSRFAVTKHHVKVHLGYGMKNMFY